MKEIFEVEINNLDELQNLLHRADKQIKDLKSTLNKINNFKLKNKKPEFNENSDHRKKN